MSDSEHFHSELSQNRSGSCLCEHTVSSTTKLIQRRTFPVLILPSPVIFSLCLFSDPVCCVGAEVLIPAENGPEMSHERCRGDLSGLAKEKAA